MPWSLNYIILPCEMQVLYSACCWLCEVVKWLIKKLISQTCNLPANYSVFLWSEVRAVWCGLWVKWLSRVPRLYYAFLLILRPKCSEKRSFPGFFYTFLLVLDQSATENWSKEERFSLHFCLSMRKTRSHWWVVIFLNPAIQRVIVCPSSSQELTPVAPPATPSEPRSPFVVDDSEFLSHLEGLGQEEMAALVRKQRQAALRYKGRFSEVGLTFSYLVVLLCKLTPSTLYIYSPAALLNSFLTVFLLVIGLTPSSLYI